MMSYEEAKTIGFVGLWELPEHTVREYHDRIAIARNDDAVMSWEELQAIKNRIWGKGVLAIELYPAENEVVNLRNTRHLWRLDGMKALDIRATCTHEEFGRVQRQRVTFQGHRSHEV